VVPSLYEPFGIVALEAAAARTPLVVSDVGGLRDLVANGVAAACFSPGDAEGLTGAVSKVLGDPDRVRTVTRATRVIRRDYTWAAVAERTVEVYRDVV
jgi:glycogen synthase